MSRVLVAGGSEEALVQAARYSWPLANQLEAGLEAVTVASSADAAGELLVRLGGLVDRLHCYIAAGPLPLTGALLADALEQAAAEDGFHLVLLGDHAFSREAAARLAIRLGGPCASMCDVVSIEDGEVTVERSVLGGVATGRLKLEGGPAVCVLAPGVSVEAPLLEGSAELVVRDLSPGTAATALTKTAEQKLSRVVDLTGAKRVVSVGRGFLKADDLSLADDLRHVLEAELGCSRPVAEDFKWLPQERLVGLTGSAVSAELYLALGISGQVQHLAGIKGAKVVAAVNNDPKSPITRNADYTVVGDLYKVVPALIEALKSRQDGA